MKRSELSRSPMTSRRRSTGPDKATRALVIERAQGRCEFGDCRGDEIQHRVCRSGGGGNDLFNLLLLCRSHHAWAETRDLVAKSAGLWVSRYENPALIPLRPLHGPPVWLSATGTYLSACPTERNTQ